jgi:glycosyltransferase involved in cell wall biosynthesis
MNVLVDLKPALDGYAGIPQECRLLFKGLSQMGGFGVEGLIQHGGRRLRAALPSQHQFSQDKQIDRLSKFVVSMYEKPFDNFAQAVLYDIQRRFSRGFLRLRANLGLSLPLSRFEADLFEDFVWRTFFSKTLNADCQAQLMQTRHRVLSVPRQMMHKAGLDGLKFSQTPSYAQIDTRGFDAFVTQNPFPGRVAKGTQMVVRYHDAVPILMPHTTRDKAFDQAAHFHALKDNLKQGAWFSCISQATRNDLLTIFPQAEQRSVVIPNIVSDEYYPDTSPPQIVYQVIRNRIAVDDTVKTKLPKSFAGAEFNTDATNQPPLQYLLMVSTIEPRKNHQLLMQAWEMLRYSTHPHLKLVVVGNMGWDQGPVLQSFRPWAERGDLFWLNNVPAAELRALYTHAAATVCPGLAEGFDYSGVEAMKCGCPVAASDIPVHREIYDQAAVYFNTYSAADASQCIGQLLSPQAQAQREQLRTQGLQVGQRYTETAILPQWAKLFERLTTPKH